MNSSNQGSSKTMTSNLGQLGSWETMVFQSKGDDRGELIALQGLHEVPFEIKRVYMLTKTLGDVTRGLHAHRKLDQVLVAVSGSCKVTLDTGVERQTIELDRPTAGLRITNLVWRELFDFSPDCVVVVMASAYYDPSDYIRNYDEFLRVVGELSK